VALVQNGTSAISSCDVTASPPDTIPADVLAKRWWILAVLCLSLIVVMLTNTSLNVALPILGHDLHGSNSDLQWMVDAYSLVFAGLLFTAGTVGDRYGRKRILQAGLLLFAAASTYAAVLADSAADVIAARAVMGAGGAMIMPATLSILVNAFPRHERAKAVAIWAGVSGGGTAIGPIVAGFLLEHFSWHSVFIVSIPAVVLALVFGWRMDPSAHDREPGTFDPIGAVLSIAGLVSLVYGIIEAPAEGWLSGHTVGFIGTGLAVLTLFALWERRTPDPMLDVRLFRIPSFGVASLVLTLTFFALFGVFFNMSQLLQLVYDYSPLESALRLAPISVVMMVVAPRSPALVDRFGKRNVVAGGMFLVAAGLALISTIGVDPAYARVIVGLCVMSSGMAVAMSPTTDLLMSSVPRHRAGMGSAMNDTTRELGGSLGVAVIGSLLGSRFSHAIGDDLIGLPANAAARAGSGLPGALQVGRAMGDGGHALIAAARDAWVSGFHVSLVVGAVVVGLSSLIALKWLPDRAHDHALHESLEPVEPALEGAAA
jgi:EmrB/QacA subfamily drug resistance transporter